MRNQLSTLVVVMGALIASDAVACHRLTPGLGAIDAYQAVSIGTVVGIQLDDLKGSSAKTPDATFGMPVTITNGAEPVAVTASPTRIVRGNPGTIAKVRLSGCTFDRPELNEEGAFFVQEGGAAIVVWKSDGNFTRVRDSLHSDQGAR